MGEKLRVVIEKSGAYSFVYSDALASLVRPDSETTRVSHVEPHPDGGWIADMRPVGGPVLLQGDRPFRLRSEALTAEREWLSSTWGL